MAFVFDKDRHRLVDAENDLTITMRNTGVAMDWRSLFEFEGEGTQFYFFAKGLKQVAPGRWGLADHWSLDGIPRSDHINLAEKIIPPDKLAWAFRQIVAALPLYLLMDPKTHLRVTLSSACFDLYGKRTGDPTATG